MSDYLRAIRASGRANGAELREIIKSVPRGAISKGTRQLAGLLLDLHDIDAGKKFYGYGKSGARLFTRKRKPREIKRKVPGVMLCGATTRKGTACRCLPVEGRNRCKYHGGMSTGPKTDEGRARIAESNRRRAGTKRQAMIESQTSHVQ